MLTNSKYSKYIADPIIIFDGNQVLTVLGLAIINRF